MKTIHVAYHAGCPDGILAAGVFQHMIGPYVPEGILEFIPISYANERDTLKELSERIKASDQKGGSLPDLVLLDFCPTVADYNVYVQYCNAIIVDHHADRVESILPVLTENTVLVSPDIFNTTGNKFVASGAWLSYWLTRNLIEDNGDIFLDINYIKSKIANADPVVKHYSDISENACKIINYISDYDTWTLKHEDSPAVFNGLGIFASDCNWDVMEIAKLLNTSTANSCNMLKMLYTGVTQQIKDAMKRGYNYPSDENPIITFINAPKSLASEIGRLTFLESNTSVVFVYCHNLKENRMDISIRTADDTPISALGLAKILNGGGHENSAACRLAIVEDIPGFILGDIQVRLLAEVVSQMQNPRNNMG